MTDEQKDLISKMIKEQCAHDTKEKQFLNDLRDLSYHFHRYNQSDMLGLLVYGCQIRQADLKHPLHLSTRALPLLSQYYQWMVNYGLCFFLTDPDVEPDPQILGFIQKWVYDQL